MYKFEIHLHSSGCSGCATSDSIELVDAAKNHGYSGVVFTNHFYRGNTALDRKLPWEEFVAAYEEDYLKAKEYGDKIGIKVFFGVEEVFAAGKEMLIYGISPETFKKTPEFRTMNAYEKADFQIIEFAIEDVLTASKVVHTTQATTSAPTTTLPATTSTGSLGGGSGDAVFDYSDIFQ
jgi:hypothetical protein